MIKHLGWYNATPNNTYDSYHGDIEKINQEQWKVYFGNLKNLVSNPKRLLVFHGKKFASMWTESTNQALWTNYSFYESDYLDMPKEEERIQNNKFLSEIYFGTANNLIIYYFKALAIIIYLGTLVGLIINRKNINTEHIALIIIFLGGFVFHIIWEAKSRYIIPYIMVLLPFSTNILFLIDSLKNKIIKKW